MTKPVEIAPDVAYFRAGFANIYFAGSRESWVLIDTGGPGYAERIIHAAETRFGAGARPAAIVLTHGHFDHAASARQLARHWDRPVYAHSLEFPYLTGVSVYPAKDPTVGGAMGFLSRFFPSRTANLSEVLRDLPETGSVPGLPGWMWIFTPGHAPGHVAFWRESDRVLVAGDALATADFDSWYGVVTQRRRVSRPPSPFTYDWDQARRSVIALAALQPLVLGCGHGDPMGGGPVAPELDELARTFTPPGHGRYVAEPAQANEHGVVYEPPKPPDQLPKIGAGVVAGLFLVAVVVYANRGRKAAAEMESAGD